MCQLYTFLLVPCLYVTWFMKYRRCGHITCYYMIYQCKHGPKMWMKTAIKIIEMLLTNRNYQNELTTKISVLQDEIWIVPVGDLSPKQGHGSYRPPEGYFELFFRYMSVSIKTFHLLEYEENLFFVPVWGSCPKQGQVLYLLS